MNYKKKLIHYMEVVQKTKPSVKTSPHFWVQKTSSVPFWIELMVKGSSVFAALGTVCQHKDMPRISNKLPVYHTVGYSTLNTERTFLVKRPGSLSTGHDFKVLESIVRCTCPCCILTGGKAMTHSDGLCRQFNKTLVQATETAFL